MNEDAFEWDDDKAAANWRVQGVAFPQAVKAFRDPFGVEWIDEREHYGEERTNLLGLYEGVILHVTYSERGEHVRLISARRVEKHEQDHSFRENSI
ncbi:MAG: BrnT family toxin [Methylocella sp.]